MQNEISRRYARALYTAMKQTGTQEKGLSEILLASSIFENKGGSSFGEYFSNPLVPRAEKKELIKKAYDGKGFSPEVLNLLLLMTEKGRLSYLSEVAQAYQAISDGERGVTRGTVRAAQPLSSPEQKNLEDRINQILKKKIVLTFKEDQSLLGGVVADVGGWTFDDSLEMHLKKLNEALMK